MTGRVGAGGWQHVRAEFRLDTTAPQRRATRKQPHRSGPVTVITIHKDVWSAALRAANGDARRITVISPTEVIVSNHPRGHSS